MAQITIIRTSDRGAHLITDGTRVAWIQGRWYREDGTLTPRGAQALADGQTMEEIEAAKKAAEERKIAEREEGRKLITVRIPAGMVENYSEKAWKIYSGSKYYNKYKRLCRASFFAPKSQIEVNVEEEGTILVTMPKWYFRGEWTIQGMRTDSIEMALVCGAGPLV